MNRPRVVRESETPEAALARRGQRTLYTYRCRVHPHGPGAHYKGDIWHARLSTQSAWSCFEFEAANDDEARARLEELYEPDDPRPLHGGRSMHESRIATHTLTPVDFAARARTAVRTIPQGTTPCPV